MIEYATEVNNECDRLENICDILSEDLPCQVTDKNKFYIDSLRTECKNKIVVAEKRVNLISETIALK